MKFKPAWKSWTKQIGLLAIHVDFVAKNTLTLTRTHIFYENVLRIYLPRRLLKYFLTLLLGSGFDVCIRYTYCMYGGRELKSLLTIAKHLNWVLKVISTARV